VNLDKFYTIKNQLNSNEQADNLLENLQNSNIIVCLVDKSFLNCQMSMANLQLALELKKEIFLFQYYNEHDDISPIHKMYAETDSNPRWIQMKNLIKIQKIFNARLK
jgi:hypothetical protein